MSRRSLHSIGRSRYREHLRRGTRTQLRENIKKKEKGFGYVEGQKLQSQGNSTGGFTFNTNKNDMINSVVPFMHIKN